MVLSSLDYYASRTMIYLVKHVEPYCCLNNEPNGPRSTLLLSSLRTLLFIHEHFVPIK